MSVRAERNINGIEQTLYIWHLHTHTHTYIFYTCMHTGTYINKGGIIIKLNNAKTVDSK